MSAARPLVHFISLGCPKNRVDSEQMLAQVEAAGMRAVGEPDEADAIVVHTCGFIGAATEESIDTVLAMAEHKSSGRCKALVVSGCLAQRHADELAREIPEIDALLGTASYDRVAETIRGRLAQSDSAVRIEVGRPGAPVRVSPRRSLGDHGGSAYLKIAEGCDRACAFCVIPSLRGPQRSRGVDDIVAEARGLAEQGVVEINLIAQDLTAYGHDLPGKPGLDLLLAELDQVESLAWIRCLYAYPQGVTPRLRRALARSRRVLPYLDVPIQHASSGVLRRMCRGSGGVALRTRLRRLRDEVPGLVLRTTLLVGFPGETDADFAELCELVEDIGFDRLGVFVYSDEAGTAAHSMRNKVPASLARKRRRRLLSLQKKISRRRLRALCGQVHQALVEGLHPESELLVVGRLWSQAPEIDGQCIISSAEPLRRGQLVSLRIVDSHDYDLVGERLEPGETAPARPFA